MITHVSTDTELFTKCAYCYYIEAADNMLWSPDDKPYCSRECLDRDTNNIIYDAEFANRARFEDWLLEGVV